MNLIPKWMRGRAKSDDASGLRPKSISDVAWTSTGDLSASPDQIGFRAAAAQSKNLSPTDQYVNSIAVLAAVNAIGRNISKCKLRLFTRSGREVVGGPLFDLLRMPGPKFSQRKLLWEISMWLNIAGEFFVNAAVPVNGMPTVLRPVNPYRIKVSNPAKIPKSRDEVIQWLHRWGDGTDELIRDDYLVFERLFNPEPTSIRGLSPLVTGAVQVSASYYAERYNKQFFENSAIPSHIVVLPPGTPKIQRDAFERRYMATYGNGANQGHRVAIVAGGKDFKIEQTEQSFQDGAFMEMQKRGDLKVGQLYRVPAINMGIYDKSRFDTANEERKLFLEETLEPEAELIAEAFQFQLVDQHFRMSAATTTGTAMKEQPRSVQKQFEKAEGERRGGNLLVILDTDTLPIKHEVLLSKTESALKMREAYDISAKKAEEWMGLDFGETDKVREEIFTPNTRVCITDPALNAALTPGVKPEGTGAADGGGGAKPAEKPKPDPKKIKAVEKFLRAVRRPTFDALDAGSMWSLEQGDALAGDESLKPVVRRVRHALRKLNKDQVRSWLAGVKPASLLGSENV